MRVSLDTNVLLSGLISARGIPALLIEAWLDRRFTLVCHTLLLDELREVSRREKIRTLLRPVEVGRLVNQITLIAELPTSLPHVRRSPDPRDDFLLALCEAGPADWLVTGNKDALLALGRHGPARIVTAATLAEQLGIRRSQVTGRRRRETLLICYRQLPATVPAMLASLKAQAHSTPDDRGAGIRKASGTAGRWAR